MLLYVGEVQTRNHFCRMTGQHVSFGCDGYKGGCPSIAALFWTIVVVIWRHKKYVHVALMTATEIIGNPLGVLYLLPTG